MVEIMIPALDKEYDFRVDEYSRVKVLIEEIIEMVCHKEQDQIIGDEKELILCHLDTCRILSSNDNLHNSGVKNGDKLILV